MQVILNTDNNLRGSEDLTAAVEADVTAALGRFTDRVTRVEVHINDENSVKGGGRDKRCMMEARVRGHQPIAVTANAGSVELALASASDKLARALDSAFGRMDDKTSPSDSIAGES